MIDLFTSATAQRPARPTPVMHAATARLSAVMMIAAGAAAACVSAAPAPPSAPTTEPSNKVAMTEASPAKPPAPLPTTLLPGIGMSSSSKKSHVDDDGADDMSGPAPSCSKDEDCWSKTCCPAKAPEECVHASRARHCAIVDVSCKPSPMHYTCVCDSGSCKGRLAPP